MLTVHEKFYEETLDPDLEKLLSKNLRIEKVNAFKITKPRLIGDIGLRAFFQLYKRARQLIRKEKIHFLYILIPSFYCALLGRWLHFSTGIKYGIDYIDPWVHKFPGSNNLFSRHWFSTKLSKILEPIAVKKASLITGVAEGYYQGVIDRNPHLASQAIFGAMPYGGEEADQEKIKAFIKQPYLFKKTKDKIQLVFAGALLPKAFKAIEAIFKSIHKQPEMFAGVEFHFIGTGKRANDPESYTIKPLAEKYKIWQTIIFEYPARIPYHDVLIHLSVATGIFILGSSEAHYTPSKIYQAILSEKPILAVLHTQSTATELLKKTNAAIVLNYDGENDFAKIENTFGNCVNDFKKLINEYDPQKVDKKILNEYSAESVSKQLVFLLNKIKAT